MAIKEVLHSDFAPKAVGPYSQAVVTGNLIFTSGQVPIDPKTGKIEAATIEEQTEQVMKNLHYVLAQGGVAFDRVVKTTCFLADLAAGTPCQKGTQPQSRGGHPKFSIVFHESFLLVLFDFIVVPQCDKKMKGLLVSHFFLPGIH